MGLPNTIIEFQMNVLSMLAIKGEMSAPELRDKILDKMDYALPAWTRRQAPRRGPHRWIYILRKAAFVEFHPCGTHGFYQWMNHLVKAGAVTERNEENDLYYSITDKGNDRRNRYAIARHKRFAPAIR